MTEGEIFNYQQEVWSRTENSGYDELVDMTAVSEINFTTPNGISKLAGLSSSMDAPTSPSKFAIIVTTDLHFGLGRMYQARREMAKGSTKVIRVFRSRREALEWLGFSIKDD